MASSSKTTRDCSRTPRCSILLTNVLGITLAQCSLDVDQDGNTASSNSTKPQQPCSGKKLFDSFLDNNKSTLHTRLNESLAEIRFAGWIQPFTLLIKGPQEELDVITEAWRRRFLRSPEHFTIREIGTIKSIDTEVIQQAPFLPLTKAVYEAISALNKNNLPSGQKQVFEYLAHTYQYVHVPKPNVIRDCLGILFKEGKVYATENNEYFVFIDTSSDKTDLEKKESELSTEKERLIRPKDKTHACLLCEQEKTNAPTHTRDKRTSKHIELAHLCEKHKVALKNRRKSTSSKESSSRDIGKENKELKTEKKEKNGKTEKKNEENHSKKQREKGNKKTVWSQIAGFMKGKSSTTEKKETEVKTLSTASSENPESISSVDNSRKPQKITEQDVPVSDVSSNEKQVSQFQRSRSFNAHSKKRPDLTRSNSFAGNTSKPKAVDYDIMQMRKTTEPTKANIGVEQGHSSPRDSGNSSTAEKTLQNNPDASRQRNSTCAVGVVRPWKTQNIRADGRPLSRSSSMKETRKMAVSSPSTPTNEFQRSALYTDFKMSTTTNADFQRQMSRDSKMASQTNDLQRSLCMDLQMAMPSSNLQRLASRDSKTATPNNEFQRSISRDSKTATPNNEFLRSISKDSKTASPNNDFQRSISRDSKTATPNSEFQRSISRDSKTTTSCNDFQRSSKVATAPSDFQNSVSRNSKTATPPNDFQRSLYIDSKMPTSTSEFHRQVFRDSNISGTLTSTGDIRLRDPKSVETSSSTLTSGMRTPTYRDFRVMGSLTPTGDMQRPVMRDPTSVKRSLSLKENRRSDITPLSYQRTHVNLQKDFLSNESPLKHILTKNTGNTLPISPNHPNYIPAATIQDRTRPPAQNRNSFPNFPNSNSWKRASWRTTPTDERDLIGPTAKGLLLDDANLRKHDELFYPIQYLQQNQRMLPCDCSDAGYSESSGSRVLSDCTSAERKSVSSADRYQSAVLNKHKNECASSINSTSDNGILLDEISSSCSSEIRSIMNHDNTLADNQEKSPYTVAKGEVVLDSSLTFIGII